MVKYYCDKCKKEVRIGDRYDCSFNFEKPNNFKVTPRRRCNVLLCTECATSISEKLEKIMEDIRKNN